MNKNNHNYYNIIAKGYDELHSEEQNAKFARILKELTLLGLNKKSELLDIGCGTCKSFNYFPCKVFGIEPSKEMAKQNPEYETLIDSGKLIICGAENMMNCFKEKKFDFIICVTAAHHFIEEEKTFSEINKKLKKEGFAVFSLLKGTEKKTEQQIKKIFLISKKILPNKIQKDTILICKKA